MRMASNVPRNHRTGTCVNVFCCLITALRDQALTGVEDGGDKDSTDERGEGQADECETSSRKSSNSAASKHIQM